MLINTLGCCLPFARTIDQGYDALLFGTEMAQYIHSLIILMNEYMKHAKSDNLQLHFCFKVQ